MIIGVVKESLIGMLMGEKPRKGGQGGGLACSVFLFSGGLPGLS
jgi:hypothetical protein